MIEATEDRTLVQMEQENGKFEVSTLYKAIRKIESTGMTSVGLSYCKLIRPEHHTPGQPDKLEGNVETEMEYVLTATARDNYMNKTIFSCKLKSKTFPTAALAVAQRFRFVSVGKNLKPTKPYIVTSRAVTLTPGRPKHV